MYMESLLRLCLPVAEADSHDAVALAAQTKKLEQFWSGLRPVLDTGLLGSHLHDVAQLTCNVPDQTLRLPSQEPEDVVS